MELLTLSEIVQSIVEETRGLKPEIADGITLKQVDIPFTQIELLKEKLGLKTLNQNFIDYILKYNWGNFGFLAYQFGYNDADGLNWLVQRNLDYEDFTTLKECGFIIIANGDPYTILLECVSGKIFAIDSETDLDKRIPIAESFEQLVRGMGTGQYACWNKQEAEFIKLMDRTTNSEGMLFWHSFVSYY